MGIPKFFRFISERWPLISQLADGYQLPEFDNLYLDMNSILHTCTRPKDDEISRKLSEEEVFSAIFAYIDHLFDTIRPHKVFYMAIDGVAPRAKMNQQRSRRFRTALDAEKNMEKALKEGLDIPKEPFDSNSITPGTEFMAKLTGYLKYFIHKKISTDSRWQGVNVILSGHEVPGEGEHKIMEFIKNKKATREHDPNTRHCIYGLDADLIMLGLVSHEPHFALLREEVTFGRKQTQPKSLEDQTFYLLHLGLVREYLELEFQELKDQLKFDYDFERILDDFILIMYVIGNDFLPNLPDLHLNKGAFPLLLQTFKEALRSLDGYINEFGKINLKRLAIWLDYLTKFELENFEQDDVDLEWFNRQLETISISGEKRREKQGKLLILKQQKKLVSIIKPWLIKNSAVKYSPSIKEDEIPSLDLPAEDVKNNLDFIKSFAFDAGLVLVHSQSRDAYSVRIDVDGIDPNETNEEFEERVNDTRRIIKRYQAAIVLDADGEEAVEEKKIVYNEKFEQWKDEYYKEKVHFSLADEDKIKEMTENYVEGLQWVLYYYYQGVPSWSWYYRYHYSPRISDIKKGLGVTIDFDKGTPFRPFQQLMAVLPARSRKLLPATYRPLMTDPNSPIYDFYPSTVETDMNGKTADWEAVVKISFVDQKRLMDAMQPHDLELTPEEKRRNSFGQDILFTFNPQIEEVYKTPLAGVFTDLENNHCFETPYQLEHINPSQFVTGLCPGVLLGADSLAGFPSLKSVPFANELRAAGLKIFNFPSRSTSMILIPDDIHQSLSIELFAKRYINKIVYTRYPYLRESKLVSICDGETEYFDEDKGGKLKSTKVSPEDAKQFRATKANIVNNYLSTKGIELKNVTALVKVKPVSGLRRNASGAFVKDFSSVEEIYPLQLVIESVKNIDQRLIEKAPLPINEEYPIGSKVIFLGDYAYGGQATIKGYSSTKRLVIDVLKTSIKAEPTIGSQRASIEQKETRYFPSYEVSRNLKLHPLFLSKITSSFSLQNPKNQRVNVGLDLKFEARREKVLGFSKKNERGWEYSIHTIELIKKYRSLFPDFFNGLARLSNSPGKFPSYKEIWPGIPDSEASKRLEAINSWLKGVKEAFVRVSLESDSLSRKGLQIIENEIEKYSVVPDNSEHKKLAGVPRDAVLDPRVSFDKLKAQSFKLGDRVIYVHDSGKVPLFSKGTVVGYLGLGSNVTLQILFDKPLTSGNKFEGRVRTNRGLSVDSSLVLNLSYKQYIFHSKASAAKTGSKKVDRKSNITPKPQISSSKNGAPNPKAHTILDKAKPIPPQKSESIKKSNELLSLLKGKESTTRQEAQTDTPQSVPDQSLSDFERAKTNFTLRHIQASIVNGSNFIPSGSIVAPPFELPGQVPIGFTQPFQPAPQAPLHANTLNYPQQIYHANPQNHPNISSQETHTKGDKSFSNNRGRSKGNGRASKSNDHRVGAKNSRKIDSSKVSEVPKS